MHICEWGEFKGWNRLKRLKLVLDLSFVTLNSELRTLYSLLIWSGRADLNGRPPAPKAGALTRLRYAPIYR